MSEPAPRESLDAAERERVEELERRIRSIEAEYENAYGSFTRWDWWLCAIGAVLLPLLLILWFRP